eukprot:1157151-Pelagomonas_calceolata.AAC.5
MPDFARGRWGSVLVGRPIGTCLCAEGKTSVTLPTLQGKVAAHKHTSPSQFKWLGFGKAGLPSLPEHAPKSHKIAEGQQVAVCLKQVPGDVHRNLLKAYNNLVPFGDFV